MKICNKEELRLFEDTLEQCEHSVLVLTPEGDQYDLKNPMEKYLGIASLIGDEDPELQKEDPDFDAYCDKVIAALEAAKKQV